MFRQVPFAGKSFFEIWEEFVNKVGFGHTILKAGGIVFLYLYICIYVFVFVYVQYKYGWFWSYETKQESGQPALRHF